MNKSTYLLIHVREETKTMQKKLKIIK